MNQNSYSALQDSNDIPDDVSEDEFDEGAQTSADYYNLYQFHNLKNNTKTQLNDSDFQRDKFNKSCSLLASSSLYDYFVAGSRSGFVFGRSQQLRDTINAAEEASEISFTETISVSVNGEVNTIALSNDQLVLFVGVLKGNEGHLLTYNISDIIKTSGKATPAYTHTFPFEITYIYPNPETYPDIIAVCTKDDVCHFVRYQNNEIVGTLLDVVTASWSPKGKQIACGCRNGSVKTFDINGAEKDSISPPPRAYKDLGQVIFVNAILWIENNTFLAIYSCPRTPEDAPTHTPFIITRKKKAEPDYLFLYEINVMYDENCPDSHFYMSIIRNFSSRIKNMIILANSGCADFSVVGQGEDGAWSTWISDDYKLTMPLDITSDQDTYPVGMTVDFSASTPVPPPKKSGIEVALKPMPVLMFMSNEGALYAYHILDMYLAEEGQEYEGMVKEVKDPNTIPAPVMNASSAQAVNKPTASSSSTTVAHSESKIPTLSGMQRTTSGNSSTSIGLGTATPSNTLSKPFGKVDFAAPANPFVSTSTDHASMFGKKVSAPTAAAAKEDKCSLSFSSLKKSIYSPPNNNEDAESASSKVSSIDKSHDALGFSLDSVSRSLDDLTDKERSEYVQVEQNEDLEYSVVDDDQEDDDQEDDNQEGGQEQDPDYTDDSSEESDEEYVRDEKEFDQDYQEEYIKRSSKDEQVVEEEEKLDEKPDPLFSFDKYDHLSLPEKSRRTEGLVPIARDFEEAYFSILDDLREARTECDNNTLAIHLQTEKISLSKKSPSIFNDLQYVWSFSDIKDISNITEKLTLEAQDFKKKGYTDEEMTKELIETFDDSIEAIDTILSEIKESKDKLKGAIKKATMKVEFTSPYKVLKDKIENLKKVFEEAEEKLKSTKKEPSKTYGESDIDVSKMPRYFLRRTVQEIQRSLDLQRQKLLSLEGEEMALKLQARSSKKPSAITAIYKLNKDAEHAPANEPTDRLKRAALLKTLFDSSKNTSPLLSA